MQKQFSFDEVAAEVNAVVEDLRWLHLELSLRNKFNEILFQNVDSIDTFLKLTFQDLRAKLDLLETAAFTHERTFVKQAFRDIDPAILWSKEHPPWLFEVEDAFRARYRESESVLPNVLHYSVNKIPITAIIMPVVLDTEPIAVILVVLRTSNFIPRIRHFIASLSRPLSVSLDSLLNAQKVRFRSRELETRIGERSAELEWTHNFLVKLVDSTDMLMLACDQSGNVIIWNHAAEELTGINRADIQSFEGFLSAIGITAAQQPIYNELMTNFEAHLPLPQFEISILNRKGEQRVISWSNTTLPTEKGFITVEYGIDATETSALLKRIVDYEQNLDSILSKRFQEFTKSHAKVMDALDQSGMMIVGLDHERRILFANNRFCELTGKKMPDLLNKFFIRSCIAAEDQNEVRYIFDSLARPQEKNILHGKYHLLLKMNHRSLCDIEHVLLPANEPGAVSMWLLGFLIPESLLVPTMQQEKFQFITSSFDAKLSQRYRFLMKYVPFPLIHLDEENRIINSNPAFQELAGMDIQYGTPISDFATFEMQDTPSDPAPCNMYLLNKEGITITHRGIISTLKIYGKTIREIMLDIA